MKSSFSHNLVVVDEEEQAKRECGSNLELFGLAPGVEIAQASGVNVYPQCEEYRRTCVMVTTPEGQVYILDLFRVKGGRTHQYNFHCNGSPIEFRPAEPAPQPRRCRMPGVRGSRIRTDVAGRTDHIYLAIQGCESGFDTPQYTGTDRDWRCSGMAGFDD